MEETEKVKNGAKKVVGTMLKTLAIPIIFIIVILLMINGAIYYIFRDDLKSLSSAQKEYYDSIEVTENGVESTENREDEEGALVMQPATVVANLSTYNRIADAELSSIQKLSDQNTNIDIKILDNSYEVATINDILGSLLGFNSIPKTRAEEIAAEVKCLDKYISDSLFRTKEEKLAYLMNAEIVTRFPYIESIAGDESKLNGTIKFYRYSNQIEAQEGEEELEETDTENLNSEEIIDMSKIFYIGDSWMVGMRDNNITESPKNYFLAVEGYGPANFWDSDNNKLKIPQDALSKDITEQVLQTNMDNSSAIVVSLGLNHTMSDIEQMKSLITYLSSKYPDKTIYILKVFHVGKGYESGSVTANDLNADIDNFNSEVSTHCSTISNVKVLNTTQGLIGTDGYLITDGEYNSGEYHLSAKGSKKWYENIRECILTGKVAANTTKYQLSFINEEEFEKKYENYKSSGDRDVFKYFTIDEEKNVVVAYGTQTTKTITTNDPELTADIINEKASENYSSSGDGTYVLTRYNISKKKIEYQSLIEPYVLPFNFLAALLVQTKDYKLVEEIANLAYDSEIAIGIYDNESIPVSANEYTYNKKIKYTENTRLDFSALDTDPEVDINSDKYESVIKHCEGALTEDRNTAIHYSNGWDEFVVGEGNRTDGHVYTTYASEISEDGTITGVSNTPVDFMTTLSVRTVANSAPTVGVVIADIWAGKWTATYKAEESDRGSSSTVALEDEALVLVGDDKISKELSEPGTIIGSKLLLHSEKIKEEAIKEIVGKTNFSGTASPMTAQDIRNHAFGCDSCQSALNTLYRGYWRSEQYVSSATLLNAVKTRDDLAIVKQHVEAELQQEAESNTQTKKAKFEEDLKEQITYTQWPTAYRGNVSINCSTSSSTTSTTYKKDSTNVSNEGEKFKEILSKAKYVKSRDGILARSEWFWDSIKMNEDTAKLENLLRYLFNIAFDTDQFGTFTAEEIENLFKVFEPQDLKRAGRIYGNTIQEKVWFSLIREGYSEYAVAGVMGCIYSESKFDPAIIERGTGIGFGLCQWSYGRRDNLEKYAASKNVDPSDVPTQIEFLITELLTDGSGPASGYATCGFMGYKGYTREDWLNAETPEDAARAFCWSFERPWDGANVIERQTMARQYYEEFQGRSLIANDVVEFALQWEGCTGDQIYLDTDRKHSGSPPSLFNYVASKGLYGSGECSFSRANWCAMFASYCYDSVGLIDSVGGAARAVWSEDDARNYIGEDNWAPGGVEPEPGWLIIFDWDNNNTRFDHVAIVISCEDGTVKIIGGNQGGTGNYNTSTVSIVDYDVSDYRIRGYVIPRN